MRLDQSDDVKLSLWTFQPNLHLATMSTMSQYKEEALDKMLKRELISIVVLLHNKISEDNNAMLQEMRKFNDSFAKLQAELVVTKRVNSELCKRIVTMKRQCWANVQYSKRECLEVAGIPRQVEDKNLKQTCCQFSRGLATPLTPPPLLITVIDSAKIMVESL